MATTPTLALCDALVTYVTSLWTTSDTFGGPTAPNGVARKYFTRLSDADDPAAAELEGVQVVFFPHPDYEWETFDRQLDKYVHDVLCMVASRYTAAAGDPPDAWIDALVDFVHTTIVVGLRFTRTGPAPFNQALMSLAGKVEIADIEKLYLSGNKLFFTLVHLKFLELVEPGNS